MHALVALQHAAPAALRPEPGHVIFENVSMRLKGKEGIRAGTYVRLTHGNMLSYYYVVGVTHDFTPFGNYLTEVQFERGTGQDSPCWDELATRP